MTLRILKKWQQNWRFLLIAAVTQALATWCAFILYMCADSRPPLPPPVVLRILCWPFLNILDSFGQGNFREMSFGPFFLALFWNAFLWAAALLELKQVLARTLLRILRARE